MAQNKQRMEKNVSFVLLERIAKDYARRKKLGHLQELLDLYWNQELDDGTDY